MKKLIVSALILTLLYSPSYASGADIRWFDTGHGNFYITYCDDEVAILEDTVLNKQVICSHSGNITENTVSGRITCIVPGEVYVGINSIPDYNAHWYNGEKFVTYRIFNKDGKRLPDDTFKFSDTKNSDEAPSYSTGSNFSENVFILENFASVQSTLKNYALGSPDGSLLTDFHYDDAETIHNKAFPKAFVFFKDNKISAVADWSIGKYIINIEDTISFNGKSAILSKTDTGKYVFTPGDTLITAKEEYDEILSARFSYFLVRKDNEYFYISANGKISSAGCERDNLKYREYFIRKTESGTGVCDSSGNIIIPAKYKNIYPVTEGIFVAEKDIADYDIYNQKKLIAFSLKSEPELDYNLILTEDGIYDYYGNELLSGNENKTFHISKYDILVSEGWNLRIGRAFSESPAVTVNGAYLSSDTPPFIKNGHTFVSLNSLSEIIEFDSNYNTKIGEAIISSKDKSILFKSGIPEAISGNKKIELEAAPEIINNRMMVPLRAVTDMLGFSVTWDSTKKHAEIKY